MKLSIGCCQQLGPRNVRIKTLGFLGFVYGEAARRRGWSTNCSLNPSIKASRRTLLGSLFGDFQRNGLEIDSARIPVTSPLWRYQRLLRFVLLALTHPSRNRGLRLAGQESPSLSKPSAVSRLPRRNDEKMPWCKCLTLENTSRECSNEVWSHP